MSLRYPGFSLKLLALAALTLAVFARPAAADVLSFETGFDPRFTFSGYSILDGGTYFSVNSGYRKMANITPGSQVAFDPFEVSPATMLWNDSPNTTINLDSLLIAGAWGTQTLTFEGYNGGSLLYTDSLFVSTDPQAWSPEWQDIDEFRIYTGNDYTQTVFDGNGKHFVVDNVSFETCEEPPLGGPGPSPVPEPGSMALLGMGALGIVKKVRGRKQLDA